MPEVHDALVLVGRLIGLAVFFQSLEFIKMKESIADNGIWRWSELRTDYLFLPEKILKGLDWTMTPKRFMEMMTLRFYIGLLAFLYPHYIFIFVFLFLTTFLITLRWRGSFNGGSDYLTLIILLCLCIGFIHPLLGKAVLWYITLQVISSYFMAGLYKIKQKKWRNGAAVYGFVSSASYKTPQFIVNKCEDPTTAKILAWSVILFELTFPLVLSHPYLTVFYLGAGLLFHLGNFMTFGLNRFFWVWSASYPALYYCSKLI
ncbi:MAG: hypothetical protein H7336_15220 [Bacteriovorax sp.]|nr:hypothetical protein [Bacteriovorax sp.]